jgi:hypothetical protein
VAQSHQGKWSQLNGTEHSIANTLVAALLLSSGKVAIFLQIPLHILEKALGICDRSCGIFRLKCAEDIVIATFSFVF